MDYHLKEIVHINAEQSLLVYYCSSSDRYKTEITARNFVATPPLHAYHSTDAVISSELPAVANF